MSCKGGMGTLTWSRLGPLSCETHFAGQTCMYGGRSVRQEKDDGNAYLII
jgi:hypothetical protein